MVILIKNQAASKYWYLIEIIQKEIRKRITSIHSEKKKSGMAVANTHFRFFSFLYFEKQEARLF